MFCGVMPVRFMVSMRLKVCLSSSSLLGNLHARSSCHLRNLANSRFCGCASGHLVLIL